MHRDLIEGAELLFEIFVILKLSYMYSVVSQREKKATWSV